MSDHVVLPSADPAFIPMNAASEETKELIWDRILFFAAFVPELELDLLRRDIPPRSPLLLVSKAFMRVALPHLVIHVRLRSPRKASIFLEVLQNNPTLGPQVRSIYDDTESTDNPSTVSSILSRTTNLERLYGYYEKWNHGPTGFHWEAGIRWDTFELVVRASGSTLRALSKRIINPGQRLPLTIFTHLPALQFLEWKCETVFDPGDKTDISDALPHVMYLRIITLDSSFFNGLVRMRLPSLRQLFLGHCLSGEDLFFATHGEKIIELDVTYETIKSAKKNLLEACPNLVLLHVCLVDGVPPDPILLCGKKPAINHALAKMRFDILNQGFLGSARRSRAKEDLSGWETFFNGFDVRKFPGLKEISITCFSWPTNE
ncbi:hypothetical protein C8J57DRAFT_1553843 [Mycena rebaudengoi]|nr:hypothetical protein C8J57DRAFT_1553843 [Mycena rebaudengoi]